METDPILDELWGADAGEPDDVDFGAPYGVGTWPGAILMDVIPVEPSDFGYRIKLEMALKGADGMKYTGRVDLPKSVEENGDHDAYERACKRQERVRNNIAGLLLGAGLLKGKVFNVDGPEAYERMLNIFRHGIGRDMPVRVKVQQRFNKESMKWENTDFTEMVAIKPRKK